MTFEVAKLAIDQFLTNSKKNSYIFLSMAENLLFATI